MAPIRIRYSKGATNIDVDLENATVLDLQQAILKATQILPSHQELKVGYPPQPLVLIPELSVASLGIKRGDQIIVNEINSGASSNPAPVSAPPQSNLVAAPPNPPIPTSGTPNSVVRPSAPSNPDQPETVETDFGTLVHRVVPDDNSCLFSSVGIVFEQSMEAAQKLRKVVADSIKADPFTYSEAVLGKSQEEYIQVIQKPATWGGAIELSIFSDHYQTEISSIDVETGRVDRFGEDKWPSRAILLYSGIHYDAVTLTPDPSAPPEFHTSVFPVSQTEVLTAATKLAAELRRKKKFTNTSTFDLKCEICGAGLKGEKDARAHAAATGHTAFGEY